MDLRGCFRVFSSSTEQETATSKTHAHVQEKSQENWNSHWQWPLPLLPGDQPCPLPVWILHCVCLVQDSDTSDGSLVQTLQGCSELTCLGTPHSVAVPSPATETETPTWSPLMPPRHSLGRARRSQPLLLAMTLPCHHWVPHAEGQMCPHHGAMSDPQELPQPPPSSNHALLCASIW